MTPMHRGGTMFIHVGLGPAQWLASWEGENWHESRMGDRDELLTWALAADADRWVFNDLQEPFTRVFDERPTSWDQVP